MESIHRKMEPLALLKITVTIDHFSLNQTDMVDNRRFKRKYEETEANALINEILGSQLQIPLSNKATTRTVRQLLIEEPMSPVINKLLQGKGLRLLKAKGNKLFIHPSSVVCGLFNNTMWKNIDLGDVLSSAPGAERVRRYILGEQKRGIILLEKTWRLVKP